MSDDAEQQAEEIEVLKSIYEGDENFKQIDAKTYQYKVCMCSSYYYEKFKYLSRLASQSSCW